MTTVTTETSETAETSGTPATATGAPTAAASVRRVATTLWPPVAFGVVALGVWQLVVRVNGVPSYVLPAPSDIAAAFGQTVGLVVSAALHSGLNALVGLVVGVVLGALLAALATRVPLLGNAISPLVAALAAMPIVALAPIFNTMFSPLSTIPRREVVAISAFVPVFVNVLRGLSRISPVHRELMQSYAASPGAVLRTIQVPGAMPYFFTGLRIASSLAVIAAVVSEYFGGLADGLGSRITSEVGATDYPGAWASVLGAVGLGLVFYVVAGLLERLVLGRLTGPRH